MLHASHSFFVQSGSIGENAAAFEAKHGGVSGETRRRIKQRAAVFLKNAAAKCIERRGVMVSSPRRFPETCLSGDFRIIGVR